MSASSVHDDEAISNHLCQTQTMSVTCAHVDESNSESFHQAQPVASMRDEETSSHHLSGSRDSMTDDDHEVVTLHYLYREEDPPLDNDYYEDNDEGLSWKLEESARPAPASPGINKSAAKSDIIDLTCGDSDDDEDEEEEQLQRKSRSITKLFPIGDDSEVDNDSRPKWTRLQKSTAKAQPFPGSVVVDVDNSPKVGTKRKTGYEIISSSITKRPRPLPSTSLPSAAIDDFEVWEDAKEDDRAELVNHFPDNPNNKATFYELNAAKRGSGDPPVTLISSLVPALKPHQKEALKFLWTNCMVSVHKLKDRHEGGGCIIAHSMGLGKTLTTISFTATILTHPRMKEITLEGKVSKNDPTSSSSKTIPKELDNLLKQFEVPRKLIHCILIVAPVNTLQNWLKEYKRWVPADLHSQLRIRSLIDFSANSRLNVIRKWHENGGILIIGYEMFRTLTTSATNHLADFQKYLQDPGELKGNARESDYSL